MLRMSASAGSWLAAFFAIASTRTADAFGPVPSFPCAVCAVGCAPGCTSVDIGPGPGGPSSTSALCVRGGGELDNVSRTCQSYEETGRCCQAQGFPCIDLARRAAEGSPCACDNRAAGCVGVAGTWCARGRFKLNATGPGTCASSEDPLANAACCERHHVNPGTLNWKFATGGQVFASPVLSPDGSTVYVGSDDSNLYAVHAASGP